MKNKLLSVGIIPDGNRRWAVKNNTPYLEAYKISMNTLLRTIQAFITLVPELENLVIYMMSRRNLLRMRDDLEAVLAAETEFCQNPLLELAQQNNAKVLPVGLSNLSGELTKNFKSDLVNDFVTSFRKIGLLTNTNTRYVIYLLAGYDPMDELKQILGKGVMSKELEKTSLLVPVELDLVVRTANEHRISDFVPLQCGYAELVFFDKYFQDFNQDDVQAAISQYHLRIRTLGR